jgi:hypothetical protein
MEPGRLVKRRTDRFIPAHSFWLGGYVGVPHGIMRSAIAQARLTVKVSSCAGISNPDGKVYLDPVRVSAKSDRVSANSSLNKIHTPLIKNRLVQLLLP